MVRLRIFIGGVHGVGKGILCKQLVNFLFGEYVSASRLLKWNTKAKQVRNVSFNQKILAELLQKHTQNDSSYIIDGHFALWNENNECKPVPIETFINLKLSAIILVTWSEKIILERLANRDGITYKLDDVIRLQAVEIEHAKYVARCLSVPLILVDTTKKYNFDNIIKQIEQMKTYTRDNILSPMLKTVIIRADFEGLTDLSSFISRIKLSEKMKNAFEKMKILPKQRMKVSFSPKAIEDGQLPITESQNSIIYKFYDCIIGGASKATLDIEPNSITLAIDCQKNYSGSKPYSIFMGWIIDELCSFDSYVVIKRLGVRKIDVQVLNEGEDIDYYFNEKYAVAQSWKNSPSKTKSILTELFEENNISFNVVQYIDCVDGEHERLIYDVDAFLSGDILREILREGNVSDILYHDMQDRMFDLFVSVASTKYLDFCKKLKDKNHE